MLVSIVSCQSSSGTDTGTDEGTTGTALAEIQYAIADDPEVMNPTVNSYSRSSFVLQQLFRGLYKFSNTNELVPALAESCTTDDTQTVYTFKLRSGLMWSDGSPLTAHDFEYSWKLCLDPTVEGGQACASDFYVIKNAQKYVEATITEDTSDDISADEIGVVATDDTTLVVTLENVTPWFLSQTATTPYMPISKANYEANGLAWANDPATYLGSGPFKLESFTSKGNITMVKNPNYYNAAEVKIDKLVFNIIPDQATETVAFETGQLNVSDDVSPEQLEKYDGSPQLVGPARIGEQHWDFNTTKAPFDDVRVRRALAISIDRQQIMDVIVRTKEKPLFGFVPYGQPSLTDPTKDFREVAGDVFTEDIEEAKALLAEAGYPNGEGFPDFALTVQNVQVQMDIAQALQNQWKTNLGIDCHIVTFESKVYWDELENDNFDIGRCGWTGDYLDPLTNLGIYATGSNEYENNWNVPDTQGNVNPENAYYTELINKTRTSTDPAEREALFIEAEKYLAEQMPSFPLYSYTDYFLMAPNVHGVQKNYIGHINFEYAYID